MVRDFQSRDRRRGPRADASSRPAGCPTRSVACVGGGSNAIGIFHAFIDDEDVRLSASRPAATASRPGGTRPLTAGSPGVLHGNRTYVLQDEDGQTIESHSISAGLDYPGVGPEHAWLHDTGRAEYAGHRREAMEAFQLLCRTEGIIPAIESRTRSPARWRSPRSWARTGLIVSTCPAAATRTARYFGLYDTRCRSRGEHRRRRGDRGGRQVSGNIQLLSDTLAAAKAEGRAALIAYLPAGFPTVDGGIEAIKAAFDGGADIVEVGLPHSDPVLDGPVIQTADDIALRGGVKIADVMRTVREAHAATGKPVLVMTYWNPIDRYGVERFTAELAEAGGAGCILPDLPVQEAGCGGSTRRSTGSPRSSWSRPAARTPASPRSPRSAPASSTPPP
jgi:hypothetical protein